MKLSTIATLTIASAIFAATPAQALPRWVGRAAAFGAGYWAGSAVTEGYYNRSSQPVYIQPQPQYQPVYQQPPQYAPTGYGNYGYSVPVQTYQQPPQQYYAPVPPSRGLGRAFDGAQNGLRNFFGY